jgi:hypothetical protein
VVAAAYRDAVTRRVVHDDEFRRVSAGGVDGETLDRLIVGVITSVLVLGATVATGRVVRWVVDDPAATPMDDHIAWRLVVWAGRAAAVGVIVFGVLLVRAIVKDFRAREQLRRRARDPLS